MSTGIVVDCPTPGISMEWGMLGLLRGILSRL